MKEKLIKQLDRKLEQARQAMAMGANGYNGLLPSIIRRSEQLSLPD